MNSAHRSWLRSWIRLGRAGVGTLVVATLLCSVPVRAGAAEITEFALPNGGGPLSITAGPDGALWFIEGAGKVGRITPAGVITEFTIPTTLSGPTGITAGPDGALWFTERLTNQIGRITPAGAFTEFPIPTDDSQPAGITAGPDGALWFTEANADKIGRITPAGAFTEFPIPSGNVPWGITTGPDGALWFTVTFGDRIGRITPAGVITEFPIPTANSQPQGIAAGPDGALWFTERAANKIGRITPSGVITEFPIPTPNSGAGAIAAGPDGALWFTELNASKIGRITTGGIFSEFPIPTANSQPQGIAAGPDGNLWFTEWSPGKIGRVTTSLAVSASVNQSTFATGQTLILGGAITNPGLPGAADFYVGILRPDNTIQFFTSSGIVVGSVADLTSYQPIATGISLETPFSVAIPNFYTYQWTGTESHGGYVFFLAGVTAGALADGVVTDGEILGIAAASYSFP